MSHVSAAALIFFQFPASKEVPFLAEGFGPNNWHSQLAGFWGKYPSAPPEDMGLLTGLWYLVATVLMSWTPPENWEQVEIMPVVLEVLFLTDQIPKDQWKAAGKVGWLLQTALKLQHCEIRELQGTGGGTGGAATCARARGSHLGKRGAGKTRFRSWL